MISNFIQIFKHAAQKLLAHSKVIVEFTCSLHDRAHDGLPLVPTAQLNPLDPSASAEWSIEMARKQQVKARKNFISSKVTRMSVETVENARLL